MIEYKSITPPRKNGANVKAGSCFYYKKRNKKWGATLF